MGSVMAEVSGSQLVRIPLLADSAELADPTALDRVASQRTSTFLERDRLQRVVLRPSTINPLTFRREGRLPARNGHIREGQKAVIGCHIGRIGHICRLLIRRPRDPKSGPSACGALSPTQKKQATDRWPVVKHNGREAPCR